MTPESGNSALWALIAQSDWVSKYVILLGLFLLSVACVAIIIYKIVSLRFQKAQLAQLLAKVKAAHTMQDLVPLAKQFHESCGGVLLGGSLEALGGLLEDKKRFEQSGSLAAQDIEQLETKINQIVDELTLGQEEYLPVLGTSAAVSPLLGLFGTIWGLIHCFVSISKEKTADIATVAPGIAEALITTLAGLIVAIPALIAFNYFANELRKVETGLIQTSELFIILVKKNLVK